MPEASQLHGNQRSRRLVARRALALCATLALVSAVVLSLDALWLWPLFIFPLLLAAVLFFELGALIVGGWLGVFLIAWLVTAHSATASEIRATVVGLLATWLAGLILGRVQRRHHRLQELLAASSLTDRLTGLYNYGTFVDYLHNEVRRADRYGGQLALVMFDLDHFKRFNDRYGHEAGNDLLRHVGALLSAQVRDADLAARYGGEEFTVLIRGDERDGYELAERVRVAIATSRVSLRNGLAVSTTVSAGVATYPVGALDETELIERADRALYESKRRGRNRVTVQAIDVTTQRAPVRASA